MRAVVVLAACLALLAAATGCSDKGKVSSQPLSMADFKEKASAAIITDTDLEAEAGFSARVNVSAPDSLNTLSLGVEKSYADYKRDPGKLDGILKGFAEEAKMRMARGNMGETLSSVRGLVFPILKPKVSFRRLAEQPVATPFPGELRIAYVVQRPDSFTVVTSADLARWKQTGAQIHRLALANLLRETQREQPLRCEEKLCGWASGDGYDAARFVVPELRAEIAGKIGPAVYAVPRESVYVALPIKLADRIKDRVARDFVTAPNPVSRDLFVERGGELVVLPQ